MSAGAGWIVAALLAVADAALVATLAAWRRAMRRRVDELDEWADMMARRALRAERELENFKRSQK